MPKNVGYYSRGGAVRDHKTKMVTNVGKGGQNEMLPSRFARDTFTGADPVSRRMNHYGKHSPYKAMADEMDMASKPMMKGKG